MGDQAVLSEGKTAGAARQLGSSGERGARSQGTRLLRCRCVRTPRLGRITERTASVSVRFGVPHCAEPVTIVPETDIHVGAGRIVLLVGPSGAGKSALLDEIGGKFAGSISVGAMRLAPTTAVIDAVAPYSDFDEAASILTWCGLGEARLWLRRFDELSDGELFRARLACAIGKFARIRGVVPVLCDEFCSGLHRRVAKAISFNVRKLVDEHRICLVAACSHEDIATDLQADSVIRLPLEAGASYGARNCNGFKQSPVCSGASYAGAKSAPGRRAVSIRRSLRIEPGTKADYRRFAAMHYRVTDELGFVDKVFVLRDRTDGSLAGIVVYAYGPLELSLRNQATGGRFVRNPQALNRELRIIRRLVIHPDLRGCGLGHHLVRKTLPQVGTEFVECLASMGAFNPVFEKAGMRRVGECAAPRNRRTALTQLRALGVEATARDLVHIVCRDRRVRAIVAAVVRRWYATTTGGGSSRVAHQSPDFLVQAFRHLASARPVYYLWRATKDSRRAANRTMGRHS